MKRGVGMKKRHYAASDYTKQAMAMALKQLMMHKSLEKISIREIMESCGMKRQNFYYHFDDIYDLVRWTFREETVSLLGSREGARFWQDGLLCLFHHLRENQLVYRCALRSLERDFLKQIFMDEIYPMVQRVAEEVLTELDFSPPEKDRRMILQFYVIALAAVIESWLMGELDYTPEELISFADTMLTDHIRGAMMRLNT